ncbi:MAG: alpha/beta fold hydrolase [Candidatus Saccharibacteria bacterium]
MRRNISEFSSRVIHQWFHLPYNLHVEEFHTPKKPREIIVLIHGMGNSLHSWDPVIKGLSRDVRVIAIDMLGFGKSPKPLWETYNVNIQAMAIARTLVGLKLNKKPIIVGHSMGSLVAIELAKNFSPLIKRLVLCSPPLYENTDQRKWKGKEGVLKTFYKALSQHPEELKYVSVFAVKMGIVSKNFNLDGDISKIYVAALQSSIIKQTAVNDLLKLNIPISILYGTLDPLIIIETIKKVKLKKTNIDCQSVLAGHEVQGLYANVVAKYINSLSAI